ncbi:MAG TPA: hypothetical protein VGP25_14665 [Gemmatimonadaceae bacterium]|nr:hypothetical protein [Gemmatimonadaceae bacterium]
MPRRDADGTPRIRATQSSSFKRRTHFEHANTRIAWMDHGGRPALRLAPLAGDERDTDQEMIAILTDTDVGDGVIEVEVSGARRAGY